MYHTHKELMTNNSEIAKYYKNAKDIWETIDINDVNLSTELKNKQEKFEHACGGRDLGPEIMAWSGIIKYMNKESSDIESAQKIYKAFANSNCINDVKVYANDAGKYFNLN